MAEKSEATTPTPATFVAPEIPKRRRCAQCGSTVFHRAVYVMIEGDDDHETEVRREYRCLVCNVIVEASMMDLIEGSSLGSPMVGAAPASAAFDFVKPE